MNSSTKASLIYITNIPSPYNFDLFESLSKYFIVNVYYFDKIESDRFWNLNITTNIYSSKIFKKDIFTSLFRKIHHQLYFNIECLKICLTCNSDNIILSGTYFSPNIILSILILKSRKKNIFWFGEKISPNKSKLKYYLKYIFFSPIRLFVNKIFAVGSVAINSYRAYGFNKEIISTPYSINNSKFQNTKINKYEDKIVLLTSGSLINRKGVDVIIYALNSLSENLLSKIEFWVIGDGPEKQNLIKICSKSLKVKFFGFIQPLDVYKYFLQSDIFIFCSRYDGWGVVINEAMSSGLPIIVSKYCGASEYIDTQGGYIVNNSIDSVSDSIKFLIENEKIRQSMGIYNLHKSNYISSDVIATKIYNSIIV